jgi:hypothetical protein
MLNLLNVKVILTWVLILLGVAEITIQKWEEENSPY